MPRRKPTKEACAICGKSTENVGTYSLIGAGWRLSVAQSPEGRELMEWRCPACMRSHPTSQVVKIPRDDDA